MMKLERNLEYRKGSSDKIYIVRLYAEPLATGLYSSIINTHYIVDCWYGRRSGPYNFVRKSITTYSGQALVAYEKIINEKLKKGYTDFEDFTLPGPWDKIQTKEKEADNIVRKEEKISDSDCRTSSDNERQKALARLTNSGW